MLLFLLGLVLVFHLEAKAEGKQQRNLTILVYMCGSNLESNYSSASLDLQEMKESGVGSEKVSFLVLAGGAKRWAAGYDPEELTLVEIQNGKSRNVRTEISRSMGDPQTLHAFINYAQANYPADQYALIFWDHGSGPLEGVCFDDLYRPDRLSVREITEVLRDFFSDNKLKWIGFDACLMGTAEVAAQLAPYAEYMIASEEREPCYGWDYSFLHDIEKDTSFSETAKRCIDLYVSQDLTDVMTLSCIDLSQITEFVASIDKSFETVSRNINAETFSDISQQRKTILSYGSDVSKGKLDHDLVDLDQLVHNTPGLDNEAVSLIESWIRQTVIYRNSNIDTDSGISIYFR